MTPVCRATVLHDKDVDTPVPHTYFGPTQTDFCLRGFPPSDRISSSLRT